MGYLCAGHVLVAEPDVATLEKISTGLNWALYKAKEHSVWLLDTFQAPIDNHYPFSKYIWKGRELVELEEHLPGSVAIIKTLRAFHHVFSETAWLLMSLELSALLGLQVFTFVSDDDETQMTCTSDNGQVVRIHRDFEMVDMRFENAQFSFTPMRHEEDPDLLPDEELLRKLRAFPGVGVGEFATVEGGGRPIHEIVLKDWPAGAGDPEKLLGIGTFDPFQDIESQFDLVTSATG